jgi:hypothetical protein
LRANGPVAGFVPVGGFACAEFERTDVRSQKVDMQFWLSPELPIALRSRARRPRSTAMILFELASYSTAGKSGKTIASIPSSVERKKAIEWMKANNKFGEQSQIVDDMIFQLHMNTRHDGSARLQWIVGSGVTKDSKGYTLIWENSIFKVREYSADEAQKVNANSVDFSLLH